MPKKSAGLLLYRLINDIPQVLLVHPGGPFWAKKDIGVWSIPKGEFDENEDSLEAAKRETQEETGIVVEAPNESFLPLFPVKQKSGKMVFAWAIEWNAQAGEKKSNLFEMEWPPKSGKKQLFAEIDKSEWFTFSQAKEKIIAAQLPLLEQLEDKLLGSPQ
jgi:predicted NUDIX family NTP pyrophosphohydrolase